MGYGQRRGRLHMGMGILFLLLSMAGVVALITQGWNCIAFGPGAIFCIIDSSTSLIALIFGPYIALASASIAVGVQHRHAENLLRLADNGRFLTRCGDRVNGEPPYMHA